MTADRRYTITTTQGTPRTSWKCSTCPANGTKGDFDAALAAAEAHHATTHGDDAR